MNREIKFRIWDIENKEMLKVQELDFEPTFYGGRIAIRPDQYNDYFDTEDMILMQYTGLNDKNGKEIYEGDIVKITEKEKISKHKVISMKPIIADIEWSEEYLTYTLITTSVKDAFESLTDYLDECDIEVIGNIYDNPELLGGE